MFKPSARSTLRLAVCVALIATLFAGAPAALVAPAFAEDAACVPSDAPLPVVSDKSAKHEPSDVPRVELAARLSEAGQAATDGYKRMRENAARELAGRPDGIGTVSADELHNADEAIVRQIQIDKGALPRPSFAEVAKSPGRPQIDGLNIIYLNPLGDVAHANVWRNIIAHQSEGPPGTARREASDQFASPTKRGVTLWVETDGTVYWSVAETLIPTHTDGADRNDNKYVDNSKTYHSVVKTNTIGVEFIGNYPDVAKPVTEEQKRAWLLLVRFLQERYGIPSDHIYAHNWIDYKDQRYCEGCELGTLARKLAYCPSKSP